MKFDSKFGPLVTITYASTNVGSWTTNSRNVIQLYPIDAAWIVPTGTSFYPLFVSAQFDSGPISSGTLTLKIDKGSSQDLPGTISPSVTMESADPSRISGAFPTPRACVAAAGTILRPAIVASTDWGNDAATGVVVHLMGYLSDN